MFEAVRLIRVLYRLGFEADTGTGTGDVQAQAASACVCSSRQPTKGMHAHTAVPGIGKHHGGTSPGARTLTAEMRARALAMSVSFRTFPIRPFPGDSLTSNFGAVTFGVDATVILAMRWE